jgi:signal-transduction protein with cAMP-binding, CBS, and nucleotidyltransferase domain
MELLKVAPGAKVYGTARCKQGLEKYYGYTGNFNVVKTGDRLSLGGRTLRFLEAPMIQVIEEMTNKKLGMTCVVDEQRMLYGVITDGDLRRHMGAMPRILDEKAGEVMTRNPVTISPDATLGEAARLIIEHKVRRLPVVEGKALDRADYITVKTYKRFYGASVGWYLFR